MSYQITTAFVDQYKSNLLMLSQQKPAKLRASTRFESVTGQTMYVDRIGPKDAVLVVTRHGDTPISDADHTRRKLSMLDYDVPADLIDQMDKLKMLIDPQSAYAQNQVFSMNRAIDDAIIAALGATAYGGVAGGTSVAYDAAGECRLVGSDGTVVTAGSSQTNLTETPLTIAKLLTVKQLLDDAEVDESRQRWFVTNPYNINQLLNTTEVKSSDYNTVKALAHGEIDSFMGFKFVMSTRLKADPVDTDATRCYAYAQDAVVLAVAQEPKVDISIRNDKRNAIQVYTILSVGAARVEGPAVVQINLKTKA